MTFHCWVLRRWVFHGWVLRRWVFEAYCREYPTRNLEFGIPDVGHSRRWVFRTRTESSDAYLLIFKAYIYFVNHKILQIV